MTIKKTGEKWKVDIWPNGRSGKRVQRTFRTKSEAQRFENFVLAEVHKNKTWNPSTDNRKLSELILEWHKAQGQLLNDGERRKNKLVDVSSELGNPIARNITPKIFTDYRAARIESGISPKTCNNEQGYLNAVFNELERSGAIDYPNPLKPIRPIKLDEIELSYLTSEQITELLTKIVNFSQSRAVLIVSKISLATGARWSEAESITLQQLKRHNLTLTKTKGKKNRTIPISKELYQEIFDYLTEFESFGTSTISAFRRALAKTSIKLPKGQAAHVLRHTFASHFMINGGNILTLQKALGHSSIVMTMRYAHLAPDHLQEVVNLNPLK
tara:strand:- start:115 stop:1098 length:984 start_codon:yes stop_codon:yes gene_type:complete